MRDRDTTSSGDGSADRLGSHAEPIDDPMTNPPTSGWTLAVDFGTSFTVAAVRVDGRPPETIEIAGERRIPSVVLVDDDNSVYVGRVAEDLASSRPGRALRAPKRRLGDPAPVVLGGKPYQVVDLVSALLRHVYAEAVRHQGAPPNNVRLTHPATWSRPRLARLLEAAAKAGIPEAVLVAEPVAAALAYAAESGVPDGEHVAVYDLGGGTFDTTVLRAEEGTFTVVGRPAGDPNLGGELFDEMLANVVGERLPSDVWDELQVSDELHWRRAGAALRSEVRRAKEALSTAPYAEVLLPLPGGMAAQRITRDDLEALVGPYIDESVRLLLQCVRDAGLDPSELAAVYQVGGASRMPMIERCLAEALPGVPISRRGDPKTAVALGATQAEPSGSILDLQAAGGRTTLESSPGPKPALPPPPMPSAPSGSLAGTGSVPSGLVAPPGSAAPESVAPGSVAPGAPSMPMPDPWAAVPSSEPWATVVGSTVAGTAMGTVVDSGSAVAPGTVVDSPPPPPGVAPGPPAPAAGSPTPRSRAPLIVGIAAAAAVLIGGAAFALTRGGGGEATSSTTTPVTVVSPPPSTPGTLGSLGTTSPTTGAIGTSPGPTTAPTAAPTTPTTPPPTAAPTAPPTTVKRIVGLTVDQANAALLTLDEVSSTTGVSPWIDGVFSSGGDLCGIPSPDPAIERHAVAVHQEGVGKGVVVTSNVVSFDSVEQVNLVYNNLRRAATDCPDPTETQNGVTAELTFTAPFEINLPGVDRTLAFGVIAKVPNQPLVQNIIAVAVVGRAGAILQYQLVGRNLVDNDYTQIEALFAAQTAKIITSAT